MRGGGWKRAGATLLTTLALLVGAAPAAAESTAVQPDGKILVAGETPLESGYVARLLPNGEPDPSFGVEGIALGRWGGVVDLALEPDGEILALTQYSWILRFTPDGQLDPSFGTEGRAEAWVISKPARIILMPDGRIAVGGTGQVKFIYEPLAAIFSADGRSREWISGALFSTYFGGMAIREDGSLLMSLYELGRGAGLVRFVPPAGDYGEDFGIVLDSVENRGGYDKSFAAGAGVARARMPGDPPPRFWGGPLAPTPAGYVLAGATGGRIVVFGFDSEGLLDSSFGVQGSAMIAGSSAVRATARDVEPVGEKVLVYGDLYPRRMYCAACTTPLLARLLPDGRLDRSFGDRGIVRLPGVAGPRHGAAGEKVNALPNGRILLSGLASEGTREVVVGRLQPDGSPDRSFGTAGVARFRPCWGSEARQRRLDCLPSAEGKLQLRQTASGVALRVEVRPVDEWAGVSSLALRLPDSLRVVLRQARRAEVSYVDYRERQKRLGVELEDGVLVFHHRGYAGREELTLEVPGGVLRWAGPVPSADPSFRLRVGLTSYGTPGGHQTLVLRDDTARPR
jgi:uncharacterized delta-60 repeat protein